MKTRKEQLKINEAVYGAFYRVTRGFLPKELQAESNVSGKYFNLFQIKEQMEKNTDWGQNFTNMLIKHTVSVLLGNTKTQVAIGLALAFIVGDSIFDITVAGKVKQLVEETKKLNTNNKIQEA
ncbi:MAG: hypothetical protein WC720_05515 [Candidatus Shapirobacteria bacterium]|jgi:hypothetical protein